jgi:hypothetical protein
MAFEMSDLDQLVIQQNANDIPLILSRLREAFQDLPSVSFIQKSRTIRIYFNLLYCSNAAEDILRPLINEYFRSADKNNIRFFLSLTLLLDAPDFLTFLFAQNGNVNATIYVDQWGYSQPLRFANIEEVIGEVRRIISLVY